MIGQTGNQYIPGGSYWGVHTVQYIRHVTEIYTPIRRENRLLYLLPPISPPPLTHGSNNYVIGSYPKCRLLLKIDLERALAAGVCLSEAPSPPRFLFGVVKQFYRFGIGSIT
jgi:hypothetical protein